MKKCIKTVKDPAAMESLQQKGLANYADDRQREYVRPWKLIRTVMEQFPTKKEERSPNHC